MLTGTAPEDQDLIYVPYWRFKGVLYSCMNSRKIEHRFMDISRKAVTNSFSPDSLGFRSQALKLRFVSPETSGSFLKPDITKPTVMENIRHMFNAAIRDPFFHQEFIGENLSMIYSPVYVKNRRVYDGVLNAPISPESSPEPVPEDMKTSPPDQHIRFIPALCPSCGWDLAGARDSMALHCRHCSTVWYPTHEGLQKLPVRIVSRTDGATDLFLPFWKIRGDISGVELNTYADLIRAANLPKVIQPARHDKPFYFWCPAFKIRPKEFLRFSAALSLDQPDSLPASRLPDNGLYPVNLPITEAAESVKINLINLLNSPRFSPEQLRDITVHARAYSLVYIPFQQTPHEIIHPQLNFAVNKHLIDLSHNL